MTRNFIDEQNLENFISEQGKFLFTDASYRIYVEKHLVNAIHFPNTIFRNTGFNSSNVCKNNGLIPLQNIDSDCISQLFNNCGLSIDDRICVYGGQDDDVYGCLFVYYQLFKFGFKNIYVLNCDWTKLPEKYLTRDFPFWYKSNNKYNITSLDFDPDDVVKISKNPHFNILDVRPPTDYRGETSVWQGKGHLPSAYNLFWKDVLVKDPVTGKATQKFIPISEIRKKIKPFNFDPYNTVCCYCNTGSEGALMFFVFKILLEWDGPVKLFEKSFGNYQYLNSLSPEKFPIVLGPNRF